MNSADSKLWALFVSFVMLASALTLVMTSENSRASVGGFDGWGYYYVDNQAPDPTITYNWIDTTAGGTVIWPHPDDDEFGPFRIGFPFVFYGNVYSEFCIGNNGAITFNTQPTCENIWAGNSPIPTPGEPDNLVAPFWDDLFEQSEIRYLVQGNAPYRTMVVEWYRVDVLPLPGFEDVTFELVLYETTNVIRFQYFETFYNDPTIDYGASATAGIENWDGSIGVQYSFNAPNLFDGLAVEFHPMRQTHYFDDIDVPGTGWTMDGMWHVADMSTDPCYGWVVPPASHPPTAFSFPNAFAYHNDATCNYDTPPTGNIGNVTSPPIDLTAAVTARLTFHSWWDSESSMWDQKNVQVSTDNVTFTTIYSVNDPPFPMRVWNLIAVNLNKYVGNVIWLRFQFYAIDEIGNDMAGWYVDDVNIDDQISSWPTNVALFKNLDPWGATQNENVLNYWGIPYAIFDETAMGTMLLDNFDKVIIASDQNDTFYTAVEGNIIWFENYVAAGGVLEIHAADSGWNLGAWPTGTLPGGFVYTQDFQDSMGVFEPGHAIMNDPLTITGAELQGWFYSTHGHFPATPVPTRTVLNETLDRPALAVSVQAPYNGYIVAAMPIEYARGAALSDILDNIVLYMPFGQEVAPTLSSPSVQPPMGNDLTVFNYTVLYRDANGDPPIPGHPLISIRESGVDIPGSPFTMDFGMWNGAPGDFMAGAWFNYSTNLPCPFTYDYLFLANDTTGLWVTTGALPGPDVICANAPELRWTREPYYLGDGLHPHWGDEATVFEWRIEYVDADNDPPQAGHPLLNIYDSGMPIAGSPFSMTEVNPLDTDYTDGKNYTHSQTLSCLGTYEYEFIANDVWGLPAPFFVWLPGPDVRCPNAAPTLDYTGEPNYVGDGLDPEMGDDTTTYTYRIDFFDSDINLPSPGYPTVHVLDGGTEVLGSPFSMNEVDPINTLMIHDFEAGSPGWTSDGFWHEVDDTTDPCAIMTWAGTHSWGYHADTSPPALPGRECTYDMDNGGGGAMTNSGNLTSPSIDLTTASSATLSFWSFFDTEWGTNYDQKWVNVSNDGFNTWTALIQISPAIHPYARWSRVELDLSAFLGDTIQVRFSFNTWDEIDNDRRGWFVDLFWVYEGDANTSDGKRFTYDTTLPCGGTYSYYFSGMDQLGAWATDTTELFAPTLSCSPMLDWTGEPNYVTDGLDPETGTTTTSFEYRITYTDGDGDAPAAGHPEVHILELGVDIAGSPFAMNLDSWVGAPGDYQTGAIFNYITTLPAGSDYEYYFYTEDVTALSNTTPTLPGPLVFVGNPPILNWTGEVNYLTDGLDPETGDTSATFTYRITYSDADNDAPAAGYPEVHVLDMGADIGGSPFIMTFDSWVGAVNDYTAGAIYTYSTTLGVGSDYSYYFYAEDATALSDQTATLTGPVVSAPGNDPPEATALTVDTFVSGSAGILHILSANPMFAWSYFDNESQAQTDYMVRVGSAPGLDDVWNPPPAGAPGTSVAYGGPPLVDGTDYYFAVRVRDNVQWSLWNETMFHTNTPPPEPTTPVVPPDGGMIDAGIGTTVAWAAGGVDAEGDVITYFWEVSTDMTFATVNASGSTSGNTSSGFDTNTSMTYYWRVNATDGYEFSMYGNMPTGYWWFDTSAVVNNAPEARFPGVGGFLGGTSGIAHIMSTTPMLNWTYNDTEGSPQAEYEVRVGTQPSLDDMWALGPVAQPDASVAYAGAALVDGTDYYFAVRVNDGTKWGQWSEVMFHTNTPPPVPTLDWPADGAADIMPGDIDLGWIGGTDAEGDAITYSWEIALVSDFSATEDSGNTGTTGATVTVDPDATYYWRVEADDGFETSGWSPTFEFTTVPDTGSIAGTVLDDDTDDPIRGALVELLDDNDDVVDTDTTNSQGEFSFDDIALETYSVRVTKSGYEDYLEADVTITFSDPDEDLTIRLVKEPEAPFDWLLVIIPLVIIIIVIVVLLVLLLMRRRKPEEAPPEEQAQVFYPVEQPPQEPPAETPVEQAPMDEPPAEPPGPPPEDE